MKARRPRARPAHARAARNRTATDRAGRRAAARARRMPASSTNSDRSAEYMSGAAARPAFDHRCRARPRAASAISDEKQMPCRGDRARAAWRNLSLAVTAAVATPACAISARIVSPRTSSRSVIMISRAGLAVEAEIAGDAVHRRRHAGDDRDVVRVGEGRHRRIGGAEPALARERADRRQHPGRDAAARDRRGRSRRRR